MADENGAAQSASVWPLPKFHFKVMWNDVQMSFQEVSGLDAQSEEIKYRAGDSSVFSVVKMPGLIKYGNVTMKKGIFKGDNKFWEWFKKIKMNTIERTMVTISLLDEEGSETMVWTLKNAWPTKVTGTDLKAEGNEVAIESIEIVHEGLEIKNGK
jgi:phage tail-like protein